MRPASPATLRSLFVVSLLVLVSACDGGAAEDAGTPDAAGLDAATAVDAAMVTDGGAIGDASPDGGDPRCAVPPGAAESVRVGIPAEGWRCVRDPRGLAAPRDVIETADGRVLLTESSAGRVVEMGDTIEVIAEGLTSPIGLRELPDGRLLVAEENRGRLSVIDPDTGAATVFASGLNAVTYLTLGPDAAAYVSSFRQVAATGTGVVHRVALGDGESTPFATGLNVPEGLFFEGGQLRVVEWFEPTQVVSFPTGGGDASTALSEGYTRAYGLAPDGAGGHFVGDHAGRIVHSRADGTQSVVLDGIGRPGGITRAADGSLLIAEFVDFGSEGYLIRLIPES